MGLSISYCQSSGVLRTGLLATRLGVFRLEDTESSPAESIVSTNMARNICIRRTSRLDGEVRLESDV